MPTGDAIFVAGVGCCNGTVGIQFANSRVRFPFGCNRRTEHESAITDKPLKSRSWLDRVTGLLNIGNDSEGPELATDYYAGRVVTTPVS